MKKRTKIVLTVIASIVLLGAIFGTVDYNRATNGQKPIFQYRNVNVFNEGQLTVTEYYGLGYKIVTFSSNEKPKFLLFGLGSYAWFIGADYITDVEVVKTEKCDNKAVVYYTQENKNIYTYCLDQIKVNDGNKITQLNDYLKIDSKGIDFIIDNFTKESEVSYDDGGTILYKGVDFNILKCHTLEGNNDIYIGDKNMGYSNNFCQ